MCCGASVKQSLVRNQNPRGFLEYAGGEEFEAAVPNHFGARCVSVPPRGASRDDEDTVPNIQTVIM